MVNALVQNNLQAQAVAAAEGALSSSTLAQDLARADGGQPVDKARLMERLLEQGGTRDLSSQLLKDLMTRVAQAGITFDRVLPEAKAENKKESAKEADSDYGGAVDRAQISGRPDVRAAVKGVKLGKENYGEAKDDPDLKWESQKEEMIRAGRSKEEISRAEQQFRASESQKNLFGLLKDSAILFYLDSDSRYSRLIRQRGFADLIEKSGKALAKEAALEAQSEVKGFVLHELENQLILRSHLQDGDFKEAFKLVTIGKKIGLDTLDWMKEVWPQKKEAHGLNLLDIPHELTGYVDVKDDNRESRREKRKYEYKEEDEKDVMLNRLRAQYLQMALRPGARLTTWFKVRKLKNGLIRLGIYTKDMDETVKEQAKCLAKMKVMEMLDEALHERASLLDPARDTLVDNKIKNCLKNLERLGFELGEKDFIALRDKANRQMHELASLELAGAGQKRAEQLGKLMARLRKESNLGLKEEA